MGLKPTGGLLSEERMGRAYRDGAWSEETLVELLGRWAGSDPDAIAVLDEDQRLTWSELHRASFQLAAALRDLGVRRGDEVIVQLPNWWEHVVTYHALHIIGAVVIHVGVDWRSREVEFALSVCNPKIAFVPSSFREFAFPAMYGSIERGRAIPLVVARGDPSDDCTALSDLVAIDSGSVSVSTDAFNDSDALGSDEISRMVFTSGTTGTPKAILHTTNTTRFSGRAIARAYAVTVDDVALSYLPLSTNAGTVWSLYLPLETGMAVRLLERFSVERATSAMEQDGVTLVCGSPTALLAISSGDYPVGASSNRLRLVISSGSSCPRDSIPFIRSRLGAPFVEVYGMNEIGWATTTSVEDDPDVVDGTVGRPYEGVEARIVSDDGRAQPPGTPGELMLRSPGTCVGYHANPDLTKATWDSDGWLRTGDYAISDRSGNITLLSRKKDLIIRGGANVSPREVEEAILTHSAVNDVSVVGIPDDVYGEVVCACVILNAEDTLTLEELRAFLIQRIAYFKIPTRLEFLDAFPLTSMGKVKRNMLRNQILAPAPEASSAPDMAE